MIQGGFKVMQPLEIQTGIKEECGVFGIYDPEGGSVSTDIYYGLSALQHRGQESCGIAVSDTAGPKGLVLCHKGLCTACFTGTYPMDVPDGEIKNALEQSG